MRHRIAGRKLNRTCAHREALMRSLMRCLIAEFDRKGFIITTQEKAKFVQPRMEKLISLGREKTVANVRRAMAVLHDRGLMASLFDQIGPYYANRPGGYTRVVRFARHRLGDNGSRAYFGFVRDEAPATSAEPNEAAAG